MKAFGRYGSAILGTLAAALIFSPVRIRNLQAAQESKSSHAPAGNAENGKRVYTSHGCYECHGREGQGAVATAPRIGPDPVPFDVFISYVRKPKGEMPPYTAKVISDQELADIYAFLQSRPHPPAAKNIPLLN